MKTILRYFFTETAFRFAMRRSTVRHAKDCMVVSEWLYPPAWGWPYGNRKLWPEFAPHRIVMSFLRILPRLIADDARQWYWRVIEGRLLPWLRSDGKKSWPT